MSLFSKLVGSQEFSLTAQGGLLLSAITMTAIDGHVDDNEISIIRRLNENGNVKDWDSAFKTWKIRSTEECISLSAKSMDRDQQLVAMANLIDIAMADGVLAGEEKKLLELYSNAFDINESDIEKIVYVVSIKNNKDIFQ